VIETYRMLGEQRQADFDREANRFRQAALLPRRRRRLHIPWIGRLRSLSPSPSPAAPRPTRRRPEMNPYPKIRSLTAGIVVALAMIVVPAAFAAGKPDDEHRQLGTTMAVDVPTDAVDRTRLNAIPNGDPTPSLTSESQHMRDAIAPDVVPVVFASGETGFDWSDAGLGAAGGSALMLLMLGAWAFSARRRRDTATGVGSASVVSH
jgi:hypothetical protein